jgi:hypothetical protein
MPKSPLKTRNFPVFTLLIRELARRRRVRIRLRYPPRSLSRQRFSGSDSNRAERADKLARAASSWGDLLAQAEDLQNLARNRRDPSFRFTGGARECEVDASQTQLDGGKMPPLTEASRDATQALKKGSDANKIRKSGVDVPFDPSRHRA